MNAFSALRFGFLGGFVILAAACTQTPQPSGFRDTTVQISATTRFTPDAIAGDWYAVARYPDRYLPKCDGALWVVASNQPNATLKVTCPGSDNSSFETPLAIDLKGILRAQASDLGAKYRGLVVMWMDAELSTATIGTVGGEMGWILNRSRKIRPDKLKAAQEIMRFNGYDISQLIVGAQ